jgi:hypothetical protein
VANVLGSKKKKHILAEGAQAMAVVTKVDYAKVLGGMTIQRNDNYKLELTLMVRPDNGTPFEASVSAYFTQFSQPSIGDQFWVRYDPEDQTRVEIDTAKIAADNAAVEALAAEAAASAVPADLAASGIPGRASLVDVQKTPAGNLIDCAVTVNVRLVDGTPPYKASWHALLGPDKAARLIPGQVFITVRADPQNHSRVALSLSEQTPVVTITDPSAIDPPARALREGQPCRVVVLLSQRQWLKTPDGDELYATKVRVTSDGSEFQVFVPVPVAGTPLMQQGKELPAKRLAAEPTVLTVDWPTALAENGGA